ncbi:MAG: type II toxin-antitoxin system RelE/ParE family toxin [Nitrospirota bacterium]
MAGSIRWSPRAVAQLEEICEHIAQDSERYAALFAKRVLGIVKAIPRFPHSGRVVPEYGRVDLREKLYSNYRIVYRLKDDTIEIVVITHGARPLEKAH